MQLLEFIVGIAIVIVLHELGHFLVARLLKVEVEEFGIGFPPRLVKLFEAGGTVFSLNWIPLGGFVRPKGENDPSVPGGLAAASPWVRLAVLFAGPVTNLLLGFALAIILMYNLGEPLPNQVLIQEVMPQSPAEQAGLLAGDLRSPGWKPSPAAFPQRSSMPAMS
jgi:regulator of sigma E protease